MPTSPVLTPKIKRQAMWEALKATAWELVPPFVLSFYAASVFYGEILTKPASAFTTRERAFIIAAVLVVAALTAMLKHKNMMTFGMGELGFAMAATWELVSAQLVAEPIANGLALLAATYLTSQAFVDIVEGAKQQAAERERVDKIIREHTRGE